MQKTTKDVQKNTLKKQTTNSKTKAKTKTKKNKALQTSNIKNNNNKSNIKISKTKTAKHKVSDISNKSKINKKIDILEYYDLPYRYNETIVKLLYQTPTTLFVYWDISDEDKKNYIKQYGEYFFNNTKPVLLVKNKTMNYQYEVDINDFANSWYLKVNDSNCVYEIELGRKPINNYVSIPNNYLYVTTSNDIESPNDHVLIENLKPQVTFQNVKTHTYTTKSFSPFSVEKIYKNENISVKQFYQKMYKTAFVESHHFDLHNPSSGNPSSSFK